ncbi:MAG: murein biosynthesis integral membrane protein MurJ [Candidatus Kerfeldbacteria bacterium]|nr:murein biosynthesis integral membrane protein MurJ [Candidatus Kerfeldbacteria bacterium]
MRAQLGRNALLLAATSAGSYVFGLVRDRLLASTFGASREVDIFNSAFLLPDLIMNLFAAALTAAFIPVFAKVVTRSGDEAGYRAANELLTVTVSGVLLADVVAYIALPWLAPLIAPGFNAADLAQLVTASRWLLLSPFLFGISILFGAILQGKHRFVAYAISPMLYNIGISLGIVFLSPWFGINGAIIGVVIGASAHAAVRLLATMRLRYYPKFHHTAFRSPTVKATLALMAPRILGLLAVQATLWTFNAVGSTLSAGSVSVFNFARNFQSLPVSFIGIALATALFPILAHDYAQTNSSQLVDTTRRALRSVLFLTLPAMVGMMFVSTPLVATFLGSGAFDAAAIQRTSVTLILFALVIPLESVQHILARVFYAQHNTTTPAVISIIAAVLNVAVCVIAVQWFDLLGLVIGFITTTLVIDVALVWRLNRVGQKLFDRSVWELIMKSSLACGVMAIAVGIVGQLVQGNFLQLIMLSGTGILCYMAMSYVLRMPEYKQLLGLIKR